MSTKFISSKTKLILSRTVFFLSKEILQELEQNNFFSTEINSSQENKGVEIIVLVLCAATVKISVKSDVKSLVSRYEKHFKADLQPGEDNAEFEHKIAENGPLLIRADRILKNARDKYWSNTETGKWHFVSKASDDLKTTSKVIVRLKKEKSRSSLMEI